MSDHIQAQPPKQSKRPVPGDKGAPEAAYHSASAKGDGWVWAVAALMTSFLVCGGVVAGTVAWLFFSGTPSRPAPPIPPPMTIQGEWCMISFVDAAGTKMGPMDVGNGPVTILYMKFTENQWIVTSGEVKQTSEYKTDPSHKPATIDVTALEGPLMFYGVLTQKGHLAKGIYKLEGDRMTLCLAIEGDRPKEFKSNPRAKVVLMELKRDNPTSPPS